VPKLIIVSVNIKCNFVTRFTVTEYLVSYITNSYAIISLWDRGEGVLGIFIGVIYEFAHSLNFLSVVCIFIEFWGDVILISIKSPQRHHLLS
jgi:hypothetical protein